MGRRPTPAHSVERRNNAGDYEPGNCYWATYRQQAHNKRIGKNAVYVETKYGRKWLPEAIDGSKIHTSVIRGRLRTGWELDRALKTPVRPAKSGKDRKPREKRKTS